MQTAPSARNDTVHKQSLNQKGTTPSVKNGKNICRRNHLQGMARPQTIINSKTDDTRK